MNMNKWCPVLIQMFKAILYSLGILILYPFVWVLFDYCINNKGVANDGSFGYWFGFWLIFVLGIFLPLNTLILMFLHWSRIVRYIIYSRLLVVVETIWFIAVTELTEDLNKYLDYKINDNGWLLVVITIMLLSTFLIKLIFNKSYIKFKKRFIDLYDETHPLDRYAVNKEVDYVILTFILSGGFVSVYVLVNY